MKKFWLNDQIKYDGRELRSHWIYDMTGEIGDAIVSFVGPADVSIKHMVDLVDVREGAHIFSHSMLHFIVEHFDLNLLLAVARQRLLVVIAAEVLGKNVKVVRRGDDLFVDDKKLSVSIATASGVSTLIHFAMNVESKDTPVPTIGLSDIGIYPKETADIILARYCDEIGSMESARCKVRSVI